MHLHHFPRCTIQNRNVHISVLNGAVWDMGQVHQLWDLWIWVIASFRDSTLFSLVFHGSHIYIYIYIYMYTCIYIYLSEQWFGICKELSWFKLACHCAHPLKYPYIFYFIFFCYVIRSKHIYENHLSTYFPIILHIEAGQNGRHLQTACMVFWFKFHWKLFSGVQWIMNQQSGLVPMRRQTTIMLQPYDFVDFMHSWWSLLFLVTLVRVLLSIRAAAGTIVAGHLMKTSSNGNIFRVTGHLCGNPPVTGEFPTQRPVTRSFDVFFDLRLNNRLSK